jgi:hypothetical protein
MYEKLIELLIQSIIDPDNVMIIGGTYETPVNEGLLDADFVNQLKLQDTYNEDSFDREYRSKWSGDVENAFFSAEKFDRYRVLKQPEHEHSGRSSKSAYYVLGVDVGRFDCTTEVLVFKVTPQPQGPAIKSLVNIYTLVAEHFEDQAINLKRIYNKYQAKRIAIDANGVGAGLVDYMVKAQVDPETNEFLPPFGVENDEKGEYKFTFARIISGSFLDPIITDENIINNSKFITELFDSATIEEQPKKLQKTIKYNPHK